MRELERSERNTNGGTPALEVGRMKVVRTVADLRRALDGPRRAGGTIGLVPTMGAFHEGHLSLIRRARAECDLVVVSVFVNPTQFGPGEDLASYPRDEARDAALAADEGVDILFAPPREEVYPHEPATTVEVPAEIAAVLCGAPERRGSAHFRGVATVVTKLFNMVQPDVAYFGQKDFQQTVVIRRLVRDLNIPVRIEVSATVREPDGLALSSRNAYLTEQERERAQSLGRALGAAAEAIRAGASEADAIAAARAVLEAAAIDPEYIQILDENLCAPEWEPDETVVIAVAATIGRARLIDNSIVKLPVPKLVPT
jgi:pantoate--beta-alanine ligase